jgi:hypothetical protein
MENTQPEAVDQSGAPIGVIRSRDAFLRALPELLADPKYDRWCAAYCGDERIGISPSETDLIRECDRRGLRPDQYYIGCIVPQDEDEEEIQGGLSFVEYDDDDGQFYGPAVGNPHPKS